MPGIETIRFADHTELVPSAPLFTMRFGEARQILARLWRPKSGFCGAFDVNLRAGILVDSYGEYPESDPGPEECTYEVATWTSA